MMTVRRFLIAALVSALAGCAGSAGSVPSPMPTATLTPPNALGLNYRFVNGSPSVGTVDVYLYEQGAQRPTIPTIGNVPFGGITPFVGVPSGNISMDVLHAGAVSSSLPIISASNIASLVTFDANAPLTRLSLVLQGTSLTEPIMVGVYAEPSERAGTSALVIHHASPAANIATLGGPIGIGVYSSLTYPPGSASSAIATTSTRQLFSFTYAIGGSQIMTPLPNTAGGGFIFVTPFPVAPFPAPIGFAIGLPTKSTNASGPLASVIANAALSETVKVTSPYANQITLMNDTAETLAPGAHLSEFLIDADQNGNVGLIGTLDP